MARFGIKLFIVVEIIVHGIFIAFHFRNWEAPNYVTRVQTHGPPHSFYSMDRFGAPYYSWFHNTGTEVLLSSMNPQFAKMEFGYALPMSYPDHSLLCSELV